MSTDDTHVADAATFNEKFSTWRRDSAGNEGGALVESNADILQGHHIFGQKTQYSCRQC